MSACSDPAWRVVIVITANTFQNGLFMLEENGFVIAVRENVGILTII